MLARDFGLSLDGYLKMLGQQGKSALPSNRRCRLKHWPL